MEYISFQCSRRGALHIKYNLPKQDYAYTEKTEDYIIAATADGHGSRRHFRSERGAEIACKVAAQEIKKAFADPESFPFSEEQYYIIKQNIITKWSEAIKEDINEDPFSEDEIEEQNGILSEEQLNKLLNHEDDLIPYGTTLCAAFLCPKGWGAIQIGDGCLTTVNSNGEFDWPMPESLLNDGNKTSSLCLKDPMKDFRHCYGDELPVAILVHTDGIEKSFRPESKEIISFLHWILRNEKKQSENLNSILESNLDLLSERSRIGDDVSIAGILDLEASEIVPKASKRQKYLELERIQAAIQETESTIAFTESKRAFLFPDETNEVYNQLSDIIKRKTDILDELKKHKAAITSELQEMGELLNPPTDEPEEPDDENQTEEEAEACEQISADESDDKSDETHNKEENNEIHEEMDAQEEQESDLTPRTSDDSDESPEQNETNESEDDTEEKKEQKDDENRKEESGQKASDLNISGENKKDQCNDQIFTL